MTTPNRASLLATLVALLGCDSSFLNPVADGADAFPEDDIQSFGGTLTGVAPLAEGLDPALLRVGAFRTLQEVTVLFDHGDLGEADMMLSVHLGDATAQVLSVGPNPPAGAVRYFFEESVAATVEGDGDHAWSLVLPEAGQGEYVVLGWYDEDGDGRLARTLDGEGSEYSVLPVKAEPDIELVIEIVWADEPGAWVGNVAGRFEGDGTFFEEPLAEAGPDEWVTEVAAAQR